MLRRLRKDLKQQTYGCTEYGNENTMERTCMQRQRFTENGNYYNFLL